MDKNVLTEKRRETVIGLLKSMNIRKDDSGSFNKDDVYDCMQQLCDLYEKNIEELQNAYESEIVTLKERYAKYDENNELYVSLIMEAKKSSNEIINQAKSEVEGILAEGKEQIAKQEEELKMLYAGVEAEKATINEELNASKRAVEAEKLAMQAEVDAEREKCIALKNKYSQQMISIEEEFMDIKTNILRTAGKIDSVKAKLDDEGMFTWEVSEPLDDIAFPEPQVEVDNVLPVEDTIVDEAVPVDEVIMDAPETVDEPSDAADEDVFDIADDNVETVESEPAEVPAEDAEEDIFSDIEVLPELDETPSDEAPSDETPSEDEDTAEGISLEDIFSEVEDEKAEDSEGISLDDIDFTSIEEVDPSDDDGEISFEGLESLFKED
ncbi:MAG: hypothetical protein MR492_01640 [Clostridiales bacterium]|nr:hypothetical protein [Clostridiales bacterium]